MAVDGLVTARSSHGAEDTADRLEAEIRSRDLTVFARIDHAAGAAQAGMALRPTLLLIFGAAKGGTPLMQAAQTIGIDLPLKALVWEGADGEVWISYNDPDWLAERHQLAAAARAPAQAMAGLLAEVTAAAAGLS